MPLPPEEKPTPPLLVADLPLPPPLVQGRVALVYTPAAAKVSEDLQPPGAGVAVAVALGQGEVAKVEPASAAVVADVPPRDRHPRDGRGAQRVDAEHPAQAAAADREQVGTGAADRG